MPCLFIEAYMARQGVAGLKIFIMISFQGIWALLKPQGEYKRRYKACDRLWTSYAPDMQQHIYDALREAQQRGDPISPNPVTAGTWLTLQATKSFMLKLLDPHGFSSIVEV